MVRVQVGRKPCLAVPTRVAVEWSQPAPVGDEVMLQHRERLGLTAADAGGDV
ncbi:MAG: hypothetical protein QOE61_6, partial [Micromonosporaceae bacterium]|nr:hypothetical protein [Micromonosporaceae bacterium]